MPIFDDDIVRDILRRVVAAGRTAGGIDEQLADVIEKEVRKDWGGETPYIPRRGSEAARAARNEKIHALYWQQDIKDVPMLSRRFGLSMKQIRRIVGI